MLNHFIDSLAHEALALPGQASTGLQRMRDRVQQIRQRAIKWNFVEDDVFQALFMFSIKHNDVFETEQAQRELNDLKKSPQRRLRALRAFVDKGEHNND